MKHVKLLVILLLTLQFFYSCSKEENDPQEEMINDPQEEMIKPISDTPFFTYEYNGVKDSLLDSRFATSPDFGSERSAVINSQDPNWPDENFIQFTFTGELTKGTYTPTTARVLCEWSGNTPTDAVNCTEDRCSSFIVTIDSIGHLGQFLVGSFSGMIPLETNPNTLVEFSGKFVAEPE